ncbi:MAG TPA: MFS transporter [Pseudonocardia sp.]
MTEPGCTVDVGKRLDRMSWNGRHTTILLALGAGWLFDSFEVQLFSSAVGPLGDHFGASVLARDAVLAVWLCGILLGALFGGRLTDRFGRRRLFVATLVWYAGFTVLTGLAPTLGLVYVTRFLAALGVGAEYAIVNAAVAEFMPARVRGRANAAVMNFWPAGAILAGLLAYVLLDTLALGTATSWRYMFVLGGLLALIVLVFRRRIPESPRWLASRGRHDEAARIVTDLEALGASRGGDRDPAGRDPGARTGTGPATGERQPGAGAAGGAGAGAPPGGRSAFGELVRRYPGRLALGAMLDLAEAFGYYGLFAVLSVVVLERVQISHAEIPLFYIIGNVGGLVGGLAMSTVFDRIGHRLTVVACYVGSAASVGGLAAATASGDSGWVTAAFALANAFGTAAWTAAYPTFTELFPTHLRGAGVGTSVAVGRVGAIVGTLALPALAAEVAPTLAFLVVSGFWLLGAAAMVGYTLAGGAEAAGRPLEELTAPAPSAAA